VLLCAFDHRLNKSGSIIRTFRQNCVPPSNGACQFQDGVRGKIIMANQEAENLFPKGINNTSLPHVCDVCSKDLKLSSEYYWCRDCPSTFYWCNKCFYTPSRKVRKPGEIPHPDEYSGQVITSTRSSHVHRFTQFVVKIYTPSKTSYKFE
jgi:hypothetical protein